MVVEAGNEGNVSVRFIFGRVVVLEVPVEVFPGNIVAGGDGVLVFFSVLVCHDHVVADFGVSDASHRGGSRRVI